ncbi:MAG: tyrosine-type recombinase/integrase [Proteobacteria bacterium]|nr:tyrosine-type recombinase/integrase [Pseudomonadota bacterium]
MASIQRMKSPITGRISYRVQVRAVGRPSQSATFRDHAQAREWAKEADAGVRRARYAALAPGDHTSLKQVVERYREEVLPDFNQAAQRGRNTHLAWWVQRLGELKLSAVTPEDIESARDALTVDGTGRGCGHPWRGNERVYPSRHSRSPATVNRYLLTLSHLFSVAVRDWRLVARNPVSVVRKDPEPPARTRFLTDPERRRLLAACKRSRWRRLHLLVLLAISTGARRSELIELKWDYINLSAGRAEIYVRKSKNGDPRFLPVVGNALEIARTLKRKRAHSNAYVFPAPNDPGKPYRYFDSHWYRAVREAGIEDFRFHDLRHTCASYLASGGASLLEVADVLGHRTLRMALRYMHLSSSHKRSCMTKMVLERGL